MMIGGIEKFDACTGVGHVIGLNPQGDAFLSMRSGPGGKPYSELNRLYSGSKVAICEDKDAVTPSPGDPLIKARPASS
jgi:hypothetical protein